MTYEERRRLGADAALGKSLLRRCGAPTFKARSRASLSEGDVVTINTTLEGTQRKLGNWRQQVCDSAGRAHMRCRVDDLRIWRLE